MKHWLFKSEPDAFSIDDLAAAPKKTSAWDGVRNFQASNMLRDSIKRGDQGFFYHSSCAVPGIAGIVRVVREGYPDATALDPKHPQYDAGATRDAARWYVVDVKLVRKFKRIVTLDELRSHAASALRELAILRRGNRLSITPVSDHDWDFILTLE